MGEVKACRDDPAFLIGVPVSTQGFGLVLIGEGDIENGVDSGGAHSGEGDLRNRGLCSRLEHGAIVGPNQPIEEPFALEGQRLGRASGLFQLFQDEGSQQDLAAGIEPSLGFGGSAQLRELGLQLGALGLEGFEGLGLTLIDSGELGLDVFASGHSHVLWVLLLRSLA